MTISLKDRFSRGYVLLSSSQVSQESYKHFFLFVLVVSIFIIISLPFINFTSKDAKQFFKIDLNNVDNLPEIKLKPSQTAGTPYNSKCTHWVCFNIYRCGHSGHDRITVYVYPFSNHVDENENPAVRGISREYYNLIKGIVNSKYYTANPEEACIFIPSLDTLNEERLNVNITSRVLNQLPQYVLLTYI